MKCENYPFDLPPAPTDKKRIIISFGENDIEFFKCFPSDEYLGTQYDRNPVQFVIVWDIFLRPYNCEMQFYSPKNQLLVSFPVPKSINVPYTIVDGMVNEWITKEEFVNLQFVFTKGEGFVKSTIPVRLLLSPANKPDYLKVIKPIDIDKLKMVYDGAVSTAVLRFDDEKGWVYDFFSLDGTLKFTLGWIPHDVVQCSEQMLSPNEKMIARANLKVPTTFILPLQTEDGFLVTKSTTEYVNSLEEATFEVWQKNADGSFTAVQPLERSYNSTSITVRLVQPIDGQIRVSCKSARYVPNGNSVLLMSKYSGNAVMNENDLRLATSQGMKE